MAETDDVGPIATGGLGDKTRRQDDEDLAREAGHTLQRALADKASPVTDHIHDQDQVAMNAFLEGAERQEERRRVDEALEDLGIFDRRGFEAIAINEALKIKNNRSDAQMAFVVLFVDIDGLKRVNDALGHPVGDELIFAVAGALRRVLRETDTIGHPHGDEFIALVPVSNKEASRVMMEEGRIDRNGAIKPPVIAGLNQELERVREQFKRIYPNWPNDSVEKLPGRASAGWHFFSQDEFLKRYQEYRDSTEPGKMFYRMFSREADQSMYQMKRA